MMALASVAQEFDYPALTNDFDTSGYEFGGWVAAIIISFIVLEVTKEALFSIWSFVVVLACLYIGLFIVETYVVPSDQEQREASITSIEQNYDVEVVDIDKSEEASESGRYTIEFSATSDTFGIRECTQYVDMNQEKYFVYCETDDARTPLEILSSSN